MRKDTRPPRRKPVLEALHDVAVPEHLLLHAKGIRRVTIRRVNCRTLYKIRLASESPPAAAQVTRRRAVMDTFVSEVCPDCKKQLVIDSDGDPMCADCTLILYPPPSLYLAHIASSYLAAVHDFSPKEVWSSRLTAIFLAHHAAEMYLKALGACTAFSCDAREEYLYGNTFEYNKHSLEDIFNRVHPTIKPRLDEVRGDSGRSIQDLVRAIPRGTAELFRYGLLLRDTRRYKIRATIDGDIEFRGTNLNKALTELCDLLAEFTDSELRVLSCN